MEKLDHENSEAAAEALGKMVNSYLSIVSCFTDRHAKEWAVNWADLSCVGVDHVTPLWPDARPSYWVVVVQEADSSELSLWLQEQLAARGWPDVEVRTEW